MSCNLQQTGPLLYCDVETIQVTEEGTLGDNNDQAGGCSVLIEPAYTTHRNVARLAQIQPEIN